jgi:hypothetical protein
LGKLYQSAGTKNLDLLNYRALQGEKLKHQNITGTPAGTDGYTPYNGNWTQINTGPSTWGMGRINCFAIHPADPSTIFAGTPTGGLWKTTNNGSTWTCLTSAMVVPGVSGICINPGNPNIMYILTGSASTIECQSLGVFKTTDGGINWLPTGLDTSYVPNYYNTTNFNANKLIMDPANSNVLLAAMTTGLYRTSDAGATWTRVISDGAVRDVVFHPTNSNFVYVTMVTDAGDDPYLVARASRDNGANFGFATYLVTPPYLYSYSSANIAVSPAAPDSVFFVTTSSNGPLDSDSIYVLRSIYVNSGRSFSFSGYNKCLIGSGGDYASSALRWYRDARLAISPTTTAEMYVSGLYAYSTSNYGKTWINKYLNGSGNVTIHSDGTQIDYKNGYVYASNDGGIYRQSPSPSNATASWTDLTGTMPISQIFKLGASQVNSTDFVTALQDNGNHSISSTAYNVLIGGDGIMARMSPNTPGTYYYRPNNYRTYRRRAGVTTDISPASITSFGMFEVDQANENRIYTADKDLYISTAQGDAGTWVTKTTGATRNNRLLAASKTNNQVFWLLETESDVNNAVLRRTINGGTSFQTITLPAAIPINLISNIVVSPFNDNKVFITVDGYNANAKVFETSNGLAASASIVWNNLSSNLTTTQLPNVPVFCLAYENAADNSMYVGTEIGMYYYNSIMNRWIPFNNGMPICRVNDLHINYTSLKIIAATYGRGIFISDFYTNCYPSITFSGQQTGTLTYSAGTTLSSSAQLSGGQASAIKYYGGTNVFLTPGFNTESGTKFLAAIGPCGGAIDSIFNRVADSSHSKNDNKTLKSSVPDKSETKENQNIQKGELKKPGE